MTTMKIIIGVWCFTLTLGLSIGRRARLTKAKNLIRVQENANDEMIR